MAVPTAPAAGEPIAEAWGDVVHDTAVAMDIQSGVVNCVHSANMVSAPAQVTFPRPFASPPVVTLGSQNFNYSAGTNGAGSSPTGIVVQTFRISQTAPTATIPVYWIAYGPRA